MLSKTWFCLLVTFPLFLTDLHAEYVKKGTWVETMHAARAGLPKEMPGATVRLGTWHLSAPYKAGDLKKAFPPEKGVKLDAKGRDGKPLWKARPDYTDNRINPLPKGKRVFYVYRRIEAAEARKLTVGIGADDGCAMWLNGKEVLRAPGPRGITPNEDVVELDLRAGTNDLLLKVYDRGGVYAFWFARLDDPVSTVWERMRKDFSAECERMERDARGEQLKWFRQTDSTELEQKMIRAALAKSRPYDKELTIRFEALRKKAPPAGDPAWLSMYLEACSLRDRTRAMRARAEANLARFARLDFAALRRAVNDLTQTFPKRYPSGKAYLAAIATYEKEAPELLADAQANKPGAAERIRKCMAHVRKMMLANPLLDFDRLLVLRRRYADGSARRVIGRQLATPGLNSHTNDDIPHTGWDNDMVLLSGLRSETPRTTTIYRPPKTRVFRDMDVEFDGDRIMFSSITEKDRWGIFEIEIDPATGRMKPGTSPRCLTPLLEDVDWFDSCYLPNGKIVTGSTAGYQGLPCENGGRPMVNLYLVDCQTGAVRQLTFEQDSDWHPAVLPNGRVQYLRWEYTDTPHYYTRILFHMNPDGTNQSELYGSGSYFPTAFKHARAIPGTSRLVGIVSGHHATPESGRLCVIDPTYARKYPFRYRPETKEWGPPGGYINIVPDILPKEKTGFVQEIPGWGEDVVGNVLDGQGTLQFKNGKPLFLYPYPLHDPNGGPGQPDPAAGKYFLVSMKPDSKSLWGIWLVDVFDNMTLIHEEEDAALLEVMPLRKIRRPPLIPERVDTSQETAVVILQDIYHGVGLKGIPRGKVKKLRLFSYHFAYLKSGGYQSVGIESSWDVKRVLGTVPVEADGSASFIIPANTPLAIQPLDEDGAALQLMRSWFVGMPGERVSCVGCHEPQNDTTPVHNTIAAQREPSAIEPWLGEARPFAFDIEVQPILDRYCVGCHDTKSPRYQKTTANGRPMPNFVQRGGGTPSWSPSYRELMAYARRPGPESDLEPFQPMEYHVSTSELVQMLRKGHHNVTLDRESWERLYAWIDLNVPYRGAWQPRSWRVADQDARRRELAKLYAGICADPEGEYRALMATMEAQKTAPLLPPPTPETRPDVPTIAGWPFDGETAKQKQTASPETIDLGGGQTIRLVQVPAGEFVMGSVDGFADEQPPCIVKINKPFWMSETEISNGQYAQFDPDHDTRYIDEHGKDHAAPGWIANHTNQPVARISWQEATAFCGWLARRTGRKVTLPTEAQWEWAARAGTDTPCYYGDANADFSTYANLADKSLHFTKSGFPGGSRLRKALPYDDMLNFPLRDNRFDDGCIAPNYVGQYKPNAWGLKDMIGNVCEWTRSSYCPYPYAEDGRNAAAAELKVARGGSWSHRPLDASASIRWAYEPYQKVFNVGFRIVVE